MREPGILPNFTGGLGNQLFVVAAAFSVSSRKGCPLYVGPNPVSQNKHNRYGRDYRDTVFKYIGIHCDEPIHAEEWKEYIRITPPTGFHPWSVERIAPGSILNSYFQFYPPLKPYMREFTELLRKGISVFQERLPADMVPANTAFLHIRRGDYLEHPNIHFLQPMTYYQKALDSLRTLHPEIRKIYVISDDIEWVKHTPFIKENSIFEIFESDDELLTFALMTQCLGGAICANSTYSWWGAYIGAYMGGNSPVYVPNHWISDQVFSLFPEEWHVL
jgi:hypothetical protein